MKQLFKRKAGTHSSVWKDRCRQYGKDPDGVYEGVVEKVYGNSYIVMVWCSSMWGVKYYDEVSRTYGKSLEDYA